MREFDLMILAPERIFYRGKCVSLVIPTLVGQYGIQAGHINMIGAIAPGNLAYTTPDGERKKVIVTNGMVKVENNEVKVLIDEVDRPEELEARRRKQEEEERRENEMQKESRREYYTAQAQMARTLDRLKVKNRYNDDGMHG